jgi:hypothetical protein
MHRVRLQFATACLEYANKAIHTFQLNQVKTNEKSEKSKKPFLTHSSGPQGNLKQVFFCASSKSKIVVSIHCAQANKDKMTRFEPICKKLVKIFNFIHNFIIKEIGAYVFRKNLPIHHL